MHHDSKTKNKYMLNKKQQSALNFEELSIFAKTMSKNQNYDMRVSKPSNRKNSLSLEPGGSVVYVVDDLSRREVIYPNVKRSVPFVNKIVESKDKASSMGLKCVTRIYSANHRDGGYVEYFPSGYKTV
jgi:hypothetical protein